MKKPHPKYKIKPNDTLQSITKLFGVKEGVWKMYHNNMCRLDDIIRDTLPKHLDEIYLLPELWNKEKGLNNIDRSVHTIFDEKQKIILHNKKILSFAPYNINNRYGVIVNLGKDEIHFKAEGEIIVMDAYEWELKDWRIPISPK